MVSETLIAAVVVMSVSLVGAITTWKVLGAWMTRNLHYLISFSAGVFLVIALGLAREVFQEVTVVGSLMLIGFGALLLFVFGRILLGTHEHHDPSGHKHAYSKQDSARVMAADALHNITDGIILVPAFSVSLELGVVVTIGIVVHELVQEISEFFVLRDAGYTTQEALVRNFLVSTTILVGVILGFFLTQVEGIEIALLGLAAGGFFYVVFVDLAPHSLEQCKDRHSITTHVLAAVLGIVIMLGVNAVSTDVHDVQDDVEAETYLASE